MRKVVSWLFISLDGVVEAPNEWQFDVFDEDMGAAIASQCWSGINVGLAMISSAPAASASSREHWPSWLMNELKNSTGVG